jgi:hypothetical protein
LARNRHKEGGTALVGWLTGGGMERKSTTRRRIVVDGSNIATEGRATPSLAQLDEAIVAFLEEYRGFTPSDVTVVVDASFSHRIDPAEVPAFEQAVEHGEMVTPPAGAIGRGDGFILRIAEKSGALVLSNDSFQEFHAERPWLFEPGRLIGGKPVPGVGWVFTPRTPVRGVKSRAVTGRSKRSAKEADELLASADGQGTAASSARRSPTPAKASKDGQSGKESRNGKATKAAKAKKAEKATKADRTDKAERPQRADKKETEAAKTGKADKTQKADKTAKTAKTSVTAAAKRTKSAEGSTNGKSPEALKGEKAADKTATAAKTTTADKAAKTTKTKASKAAKTTKADKTQKADKTAETTKTVPAKATAAKKASKVKRKAAVKAAASKAATAAATKAAKSTRGGGAAGARTKDSRRGTPTSERTGRETAAGPGSRARSDEALNDPPTFLAFIADHAVGSTFEGTVTSFTSHGAHVSVDGMLCHIPLRGLGSPPPSRARQVLTKGETREFVLISLDAARRRAELALPGVRD